jgi:hypothetical protein
MKLFFEFLMFIGILSLFSKRSTNDFLSIVANCLAMKIGLLLSDSEALQNGILSSPKVKIAWILSKPSITNRNPDIITLYEMDNHPEPLESVDVLEIIGDASSFIAEIAKLMKYTKIISFQTSLSIDMTILESFVKSAKDQNTMLIFAHPFLYSQYFRELKRTIDISLVGELQSLYIRALSNGTDPFWYHLLSLYLADEIPVSIKSLQSDSKVGKGTKYFFLKFKENKRAKSIQHYATIHINYSDPERPTRQSGVPTCDQIYIEAIGSNGVLYFNTDSIPCFIDSIRNGDVLSQKETINSKIPVLQAIIDGAEIRDIIPITKEVSSQSNMVEEKLKFYESILNKKISSEKISRLFKDALLFRTQIIETMNSGEEILIPNDFWK